MNEAAVAIKREIKAFRKRIRGLERALTLLGEKTTRTLRRRRRMSAAAKRKMSKARKEFWAKKKAEKKAE